jgi:hypothetical protein
LLAGRLLADERCCKYRQQEEDGDAKLHNPISHLPNLQD